MIIFILQQLTPEEVLKRQKRRERNKLAAARCRKKRVDQTNNLIGETKELQKEYDSLVKDVRARLENFHNYKNILDTHAEQFCKLKTAKLILSQIYSQIDIAAINAALEPIPDDDFDSDLNVSC